MKSAVGGRNTIARAIASSNNLANIIATQPAVAAAKTLNKFSGFKYTLDSTNVLKKEGLHAMKNGLENSITKVAATSSNNNLKAAVQGNSIN